MDVPIAANILGVAGAICWSVQLIPQIIINYRRHDTEGLQPSMMLLWAAAGLPLGVYNIIENFNIALRIQPQILTTLSLITWAQCVYYERKWPVSRCLCVLVPLGLFMGGVEAALIFALRVARDRHLTWPMTLMAVLSACLLAAGVIRHYWDIYVHRTVRGISFIFVGIDAAGDLFSLISVVFQSKIDIQGMVIYGSELVLWLGVFACGCVFNLLPWILEKHEQRREEEEARASVSLHSIPSSSSVFQTASASDGITRRTQTHHTDETE